MDNLNLHTPNLVDKNIQAIASLFPHTLTERITGYKENGDAIIEYTIDFDLLKQELSNVVIEGMEERYQFTWPDKKKSVLLANAPNYKTLRPYREESVNFDATENLYIEGDNLDVLKLLQETYLNKVKMIYIDPPYNTGKDFVYADDFAQSIDEYMELTEQYDEDGNRLFQNSETNGRYHTDWLNMMYPRLRLAKDLLRDDGVIFISIDDNEVHNLRKMCDEVFGAWNFVACIARNTNSSKNQSLFVSVSHEYCLICAKNIETLKIKHSENKWSVPKNNVEEYIKKVKQMQKEGLTNDEITKELKILTNYPRFIDFTNYWYFDKRGLYRKGDIGGVKNGNTEPLFNPITLKNDPVPPGGYRYSISKLSELVKDDRIHFHTDGSIPTIKRYLHENEHQRPKSIMSDDQRPDYSMLQEFNVPFNNPKQLSFMKRILSLADRDSIILDFFSGSATTAHAVMQLNAEDGGNRKFIMVQLPEEIDEKHEAYKAGYRTICDIGKERIRRAGKKINDKIEEENKQLKLGEEEKKLVDIGFRVLKADSTNMKDVFYHPEEYDQQQLGLFADNIKNDRTPEDLLFQVMLDLGVFLSCKIEVETIGGKQVYVVYQGDIPYLMACFDDNINSETVTAIAKRQPYYAVFRDSGMESDSLMTSFEQIFEAYSKTTVRKVL